LGAVGAFHVFVRAREDKPLTCASNAIGSPTICIPYIRYGSREHCQLLLPTHAIFYPFAVDKMLSCEFAHYHSPKHIQLMPGPPSFISFKRKHIPSDKKSPIQRGLFLSTLFPSPVIKPSPFHKPLLIPKYPSQSRIHTAFQNRRRGLIPIPLV
jgi:hypothetical protein